MRRQTLIALGIAAVLLSGGSALAGGTDLGGYDVTANAFGFGIDVSACSTTPPILDLVPKRAAGLIVLVPSEQVHTNHPLGVPVRASGGQEQGRIQADAFATAPIFKIKSVERILKDKTVELLVTPRDSCTQKDTAS